MSNDLEAVRRLTQSYRHLRGYEQLPVALFWLAIVTRKVTGWGGSALLSGASAIDASLLAASLVGFYAIKRYYDRRFGVVKAGPGGAAGCAIAAAVFIGFLALQTVSVALRLPVQLGFLGVGLALAIYALRRFELEGQRLFPAAFLMIISVWPRVVDPPQGYQELWYSVFGFGFGVVWIVMAIWDHRTLVKAFERARLADARIA
jgi:hypothetical protein